MTDRFRRIKAQIGNQEMCIALADWGIRTKAFDQSARPSTQFDNSVPERILCDMKTLPLLGALLLIPMFTASAGSIYDIKVKTIDGKDTTLSEYKGKVLLIVNVASKCGFTPQYKGLEAIYKKYHDKGFEVLGFPCNQFAHQEPGTAAEIKQFCTSKYDVTFPMFDKIEVNGPNRHPLYVELAGKESPFPGNITWNFNKFLISRDGKIVKRFDSKITPESTEVTQAIENAIETKQASAQ